MPRNARRCTDLPFPVWFLFYDLALTAVFVAALPFLPLVALLGGRYREGLAQRFGFYPKALCRSLTGTRPVWIHAASVGEVRSAEPLLRELKARAEKRKVIVSTFTATGNRIARQIPDVDAVIYLPLDLSWIVRGALRAFDPAMLVIIETEIWPNLLRGASRRGVPIVLLSGRLSEKSLARYAILRGFFRRVMDLFAAFGMQSAGDAARITELGAAENKVSVVGSLKFAQTANDEWQEIAACKDPARRLLVAGSSHRGEEEILLEAFRLARTRFPELSLVLAPRHPERFAEVEKLLSGTSFVFQRRTRVAAKQYFSQDVLLLDTVGELPQFFAAGDIAFVGGSLVDSGGHNVLEPARFQKPILFGPHMSNFKSIAEELKGKGAAIEVRDAQELARALMELLADGAERRRMGERAAQVAGANRDALALNFDLAQRYL
jgi:3-deoxy-D-manno-octulosonic-acid transferase